jgi:phage tail protein X
VTPEDREFGHGLKLTAIAVISAVLTATFVIGAGQALLRSSKSIILPQATVVSHASAD